MSKVPNIPLYEHTSHRKRAAEIAEIGGHLGLYFSKFADHWHSKNRYPTFDPPPSSDRAKAEWRSWLSILADEVAGRQATIREECRRLFELVESQAGLVIGLKNHTRFVTGMGLQHPTENGFCWHATLGTPYIPGSTIKGVVASSCWESIWQTHLREGEYGPGERQQHEEHFHQEFGSWFGTQDAVGEFQFTDVIPVEPVALAVEILTPHYGPYYGWTEKSNEPCPEPGDWHSPNPVEFLSVADGQAWICGVIPLRKHATSKLPAIRDAVAAALEFSGMGAKTASGLGLFAVMSEAETTALRPTDQVTDQIRVAANELARQQALLVKDELDRLRRRIDRDAKVSEVQLVAESLKQDWDEADQQVRELEEAKARDDNNSPRTAAKQVYKNLVADGRPLGIHAARWIVRNAFKKEPERLLADPEQVIEKDNAYKALKKDKQLWVEIIEASKQAVEGMGSGG